MCERQETLPDDQQSLRSCLHSDWRSCDMWSFRSPVHHTRELTRTQRLEAPWLWRHHNKVYSLGEVSGAMGKRMHTYSRGHGPEPRSGRVGWWKAPSQMVWMLRNLNWVHKKSPCTILMPVTRQLRCTTTCRVVLFYPNTFCSSLWLQNHDEILRKHHHALSWFYTD